MSTARQHGEDATRLAQELKDQKQLCVSRSNELVEWRSGSVALGSLLRTGKDGDSREKYLYVMEFNGIEKTDVVAAKTKKKRSKPPENRFWGSGPRDFGGSGPQTLNISTD